MTTSSRFTLPFLLLALGVVPAAGQELAGEIANGARALEATAVTAARESERLEGHLNWRERLRLQEARLRLSLFEEQYPDARGAEVDPLVDEMKEELRDAYLDVLGDELERAFGTEEIEEAVEQRLFGRYQEAREERREQPVQGWRLRFSPRGGISDDSYVGARLRLRAPVARAFWDHLSLTARHRVATGTDEIALRFDNGNLFVALEHELASPQGQAWLLTVHATF
jgi:hypothetical protein